MIPLEMSKLIFFGREMDNSGLGGVIYSALDKMSHPQTWRLDLSPLQVSFIPVNNANSLFLTHGNREFSMSLGCTDKLKNKQFAEA